MANFIDDFDNKIYIIKTSDDSKSNWTMTEVTELLRRVLQHQEEQQVERITSSVEVGKEGIGDLDIVNPVVRSIDSPALWLNSKTQT